MRADDRAIVALRAVVGDPHRHLRRDRALLELGGGRRHVPAGGEGGDGEVVALEREHRVHDLKV